MHGNAAVDEAFGAGREVVLRHCPMRTRIMLAVLLVLAALLIDWYILNPRGRLTG